MWQNRYRDRRDIPQSRFVKTAILLSLLACLALMGCVREQPDVIVITATFLPSGVTSIVDPLLPTPTALPLATPDAFSNVTAVPPGRYVVQPGDTLSAIAASEGISVTMLAQANDLADPNALEVGQVLVIPNAPTASSNNFVVIPDNRLVRAPGSANFNIREFIAQQPGFIRTATDEVQDVTLTAAEIVERVSYEYSVDARLLLAILELRSGWLRNPTPAPSLQVYPLGAPASPAGFDRNGLYRQLAWGADQLNWGYYGYKYNNARLIEFADEGLALRIHEDVNPGTASVQHMLAQFNTSQNWQREIGQSGLYATYLSLFGDPFADAVQTLTPPGLEQPYLVLPFPAGQEWFFTGGPHGGWGSGSAWAAVDFAPPDDLETISSSCYVSTNFVTAVAPGVIARTAEGVAVLDLDGDGDESTGWSILYLHVDEEDRVQAGDVMQVGDRIGRPSCEGGFSNGTHLHIARRYNGEWLPADCTTCVPEVRVPNFVMSGWAFFGYTRQEYQGYMLNGDEERIAWQGRENPANRIAWN
jgi:LysM repeat protein